MYEKSVTTNTTESKEQKLVTSTIQVFRKYDKFTAQTRILQQHYKNQPDQRKYSIKVADSTAVQTSQETILRKAPYAPQEENGWKNCLFWQIYEWVVKVQTFMINHCTIQVPITRTQWQRFLFRDCIRKNDKTVRKRKRQKRTMTPILLGKAAGQQKLRL